MALTGNPTIVPGLLFSPQLRVSEFLPLSPLSIWRLVNLTELRAINRISGSPSAGQKQERERYLTTWGVEINLG